MHPLRPRMQAWLVLLIIGAIWVVSALIALPLFLYATVFTWYFSDGTSRSVCYIAWPDGAFQHIDFVYNMFLLLVTYLLPLIPLTTAYTVVGVKLWSSQAIGERTAGQEETIRSKRKVVKMMIVVVAIFAFCWLPQNVYFVLAHVWPPITQDPRAQHVYLVIYWLAMSNAMYNPILYCWMNRKFRNGFKYVFRFLPCVHWQPTDALGLCIGGKRGLWGTGGPASGTTASGGGRGHATGPMYRLTTLAEPSCNGSGGRLNGGNRACNGGAGESLEDS